MKHLELKIEDERLLIEKRSSRFEEFIISYQHLIHMFLFHICHESGYFVD